MAVIALKCPEIHITVVDINHSRINAWNAKDLRQLPVFEPGLKDVIISTRDKNLFFSTDIDRAIETSDIIFMAVNTPTKSYGEGKGMAADLTHVEQSAKRIGQVAKTDKIVVEKSTLPVRTAEKIKQVLAHENPKVNFEVLSNPEFLAEGTAIEDLFNSDRVLIGGDPTPTGRKAINALIDIYAKWIPKDKIITSNVWSAELSKLASNAMLAQRISSINSLSALCEKTGANIHEVSKAIGMDKRIGPLFLKCSVGFGGSCFKKDILNLVYMSRTLGLNHVADYWHQVVTINQYQTERFANKIISELSNQSKNSNERKPSKVGILGWAFKKDTNDSRESASIRITSMLINQGYQVLVYDPMVTEKRIYHDLINYFKNQDILQNEIDDKLQLLHVYQNQIPIITQSHAIGIITEWDEFKEYDWNEIIQNSENHPKVFDGRDVVDIDTINDLSKVYKIGIDFSNNDG